MRAFILAAGEGKRLRPLTSNIPKPLLTLAGKPFLTHLMESLLGAGIEDIVLLVGWKSNRIKEHYGDGSDLGLKITYLEQKERLGTANAIGTAEGHIDGDFVCLNGDVLLSKQDVKAAVDRYRKERRAMICAVRVQDPSRFGVIDEKDGLMRRMWRSPRSLQETSSMQACSYSTRTSSRSSTHWAFLTRGVRDHRYPEPLCPVQRAGGPEAARKLDGRGQALGPPQGERDPHVRYRA